MRKLQSGKYFTNSRPQPIADIIYEDGDHWFITGDIESIVAVDEYGQDDIGFAFSARYATQDEIQAWKDARRAARRGRSVWQMLEDETSDR